MKAKATSSFVLVAGGFVAGIVMAHLPFANAASAPSQTDPASKPFMVSIDEVKQNFVAADQFTGNYETSVTLSDGSTRLIHLRPMLKDGRLVVEFKDNDELTYMGPNGTATNGNLMVQLRDMDQVHAANASIGR